MPRPPGPLLPPETAELIPGLAKAFAEADAGLTVESAIAARGTEVPVTELVVTEEVAAG